MNSLMIDCSTGMNIHVVSGKKIYSKIDCNEKKHTDEFLVSLDNLLKESNLKIADIENYCVCTGPGSFTGIRVAISLVKGFAVGTNVNIYAMSNFDIYDTEGSKKYFLILEGFSNFVYVRRVDGANVVESCLDVKDLTEDILNHDDFDVYVQSEKLQNLLKNNEINTKIAKNVLIYAFLNKIEKNEKIELNQISPIYLRASQAEIERNKKLSGEAK